MSGLSWRFLKPVNHKQIQLNLLFRHIQLVFQVLPEESARFNQRSQKYPSDYEYILVCLTSVIADAIRKERFATVNVYVWWIIETARVC